MAKPMAGLKMVEKCLFWGSEMVFFLLKLKLQNIGFFIEIHASKQRCKLLKQKPQISIVTIENLRGQYQDIDPIQYPMLRGVCVKASVCSV